MRPTVKLVSLPPQDYFSLRVQDLIASQSSGTILGLLLDRPINQMQLGVLIPPTGWCWSYRYQDTVQNRRVCEQRIQEAHFGKALLEALKAAAVPPQAAPSALTIVDSIRGSRVVRIGSKAEQFPHEFVQSILMPWSRRHLEEFESRLKLFSIQLEPYFMMECGARTLSTDEKWFRGIDDRLRTLFGSTHMPWIGPTDQYESTKAAIEHALGTTSSRESLRLLSPQASSEEFPRFSYPIPLEVYEAVDGRLRRSGAAFFSGGRAEISVLRARLMAKWHWPFWSTHLLTLRENKDAFASMWGKSSWQPIEDAVDDLLEVLHKSYPVLFEGVHLYATGSSDA